MRALLFLCSFMLASATPVMASLHTIDPSTFERDLVRAEAELLLDRMEAQYVKAQEQFATTQACAEALHEQTSLGFAPLGPYRRLDQARREFFLRMGAIQGTAVQIRDLRLRVGFTMMTNQRLVNLVDLIDTLALRYQHQPQLHVIWQVLPLSALVAAAQPAKAASRRKAKIIPLPPRRPQQREATAH